MTLSGTVLLLAGVVLIFANTIAGLVLCTIGVIVLTTHYRLRIDFDKKQYHDYVWFLGLKSGEKGTFDKIEYFFIKKNKVSQNLNVRVASSTIRKDVYDGYLKFSDYETIHITTQDHKQKLVHQLKAIAAKLNVRIMDYSEGDIKEI